VQDSWAFPHHEEIMNMHRYAKRLCGFALAGTSAMSAEAMAAEVHQIEAPPNGVTASSPAHDGGTKTSHVPPASAPKGRAVSLDAGIGAGAQDHRWRGGQWQGTGQLAVTALYRPSALTLGVGAEVGGAPFESSQEFVGGLVGTTWVLSQHIRLDTLGELGVHLEQPSSGLDFFGTSRVVGGDESFALPYAGLRISPAWLFGRGPTRFLLGAWLNARQDLMSKTAHFEVESCGVGWFDGATSCSTSGQSYAADGLHLAGGIRLGAEFGPAVEN
jgi:hypothetical protein